MGFKLTGNGGTDAEVDGTGFRALRVTPRPQDMGALGSYRLSAFTLAMSGIAAGTASAGHIFSFRWSDATRLCIIRFLKVRYAVITGFTAAQELSFDAFVARGYTADHGAGAAITIGGNNQKKRTSMGTSLVTTAASARIANASALSGSSFTLDANPIMTGMKKTLAAAATVQDADFEETMDLTNGGGEYPIVLAQNEGIVVRNGILMGAAGTVRGAVTIAWDEVSAY
jgi:hypothetical protein